MSELEKNKSNAQAFYDLMFNQCKPREAIEKYVGDDYIQHNPHVGDDKKGFISDDIVWAIARDSKQPHSFRFPFKLALTGRPFTSARRSASTHRASLHPGTTYWG